MEPCSQPFKLVLELSEPVVAQSVVYFRDCWAVESMDGLASMPDAVYDLSAMAWREFSPPRTVRLADCEAWANESLKLSKASLAKMKDPVLKRLVQATLTPKFEIVDSADTLTFKNDALTFVFRSFRPVSKVQGDLVFAYDSLNAYRTAMDQLKLPPFPKLEVNQELARRGIIPGDMSMMIAGPEGLLKVSGKLDIHPLTPQEKQQLDNFWARAGSP